MDPSHEISTRPIMLMVACFLCSSRGFQAGRFEKGLATTRFHRGFRRRMQSHIRQDEPRLMRQADKHRRSAVHLTLRRQRLQYLDKRNCFNVITGDFDPTARCTTPFHIRPRTVSLNTQRYAFRGPFCASVFLVKLPGWSCDAIRRS